MEVTGLVLNTLFTGLKVTFNKRFGEAKPIWPQIAMSVTSTGRANVYANMGEVPGMREWIGDKTISKYSGEAYTIVNKSYESTIEVKRDDIEDDQIGIYGNMSMDLADVAASKPDELIASLLNDGFTKKCYDGKAFFATDHKTDSGTYSNKGTKKLKYGTLAEIEGSLGVGMLSASELKRADGSPSGLKYDTLIVPEALRTTAKLLTEAEFCSDGETPNPYRNELKYVVNPWLTSKDSWYLEVSGRAYKPFILQIRRAPAMVSQVDMNSADVFDRAVYKYGVEARWGAGYGPWTLAYGSNGTVA